MNETTLKALKTLGLPTVLAIMLLGLITWMIKDSATLAREASRENTAQIVAAITKNAEALTKLDDHIDALGDKLDSNTVEVASMRIHLDDVRMGQGVLTRRTARIEKMDTNLNAIMNATGATPAPTP